MSPSTNAPTLRLPPPPPPPKPLHLTMSLRGQPGAERKESSTYPAMPRWSRAGSDYGPGDEEEQGTVRERSSRHAASDGEEEEEQVLRATRALDTLFLDSNGGEEYDAPRSSATTRSGVRRRKVQASASSGSYRSAKGSMGRGGSTIKLAGNRNSIFFDATLPNPFQPSSPSSAAPPAPPSPLRDEETDEELLASAEAELAAEATAAVFGDEQALDLPAVAQTALSLHAFEGETAFGELTFPRGAELCIEVDDLGGNWSLGYVLGDGEEGRGLIPRGFYAYIEMPVVSAAVDEVEADSAPSSPPPASPPPATLSSPAATSTGSSSPLSSSVTTSHDPYTSPSGSAPAPSRPLPSPPSSRTPPIPQAPYSPSSDNNAPLLSPCPPLSPSYASRSIGRRVVVSGIEFEPALPTPSPGLGLPSAVGFFADWTGEAVAGSSQGQALDGVETPSREEMREFFDGVGRSSAGAEGAELSDAEEVLRDVETRSTPPRPCLDEWQRAERSAAPSPTSLMSPIDLPPPAPESASSDPPTPAPPTRSTNDVEDSVEAREARWSALVEQAEKRASRMGRSSLFEPEDDLADEEEERGLAVLGEEGSDAEGPLTRTSTPPPLQKVSEVDIPSPFPSPPNGNGIDFSPPAPTSTMLYRLGLGTSSSSLALGAETRRPPLSRGGSSSFATRLRVAKGVLGIVQRWIRQGGEGEGWSEGGEASGYHIESGPAWKDDTPRFTVVVHSPETRTSVGKGGGGQYTSFQLTTLFSPSVGSPLASSFPGDVDADAEQPLPVTVERRFSSFVSLHALLVARYPILTIPDLPSKSYANRFDPEFVETRRRDLERWMGRVERSAVLRGSEEVRGFLVIEEEKDLRHLLAPPASGSSTNVAPFFARVYHPEFNIDAYEAQELVERFERHVRASELGAGVKEVEEALCRAREGIRDSAFQHQQLAHAFARLIAGLALPPTSLDTLANLGEEGMAAPDVESESQKGLRRAKAWCLQTSDGALAFKEGDEESLSMSKAVQATAEAISQVAKIQEDAARDDLLSLQELLRESSYPLTHHTPLLEAHKLALAEHALLNNGAPEHEPDEEALARCETVLNITSAEIERVHVDRRDDLRRVAEQYLDSQIAMHDEALTRLHFARSHFSLSAFHALAQTGPRLRSTLEVAPAPLSPFPQPSNYSTPSGSGLGLGEAVGSVLGLARSTSGGGGAPRSGVYSVRGAATAGTVGRSMRELLRAQEMSVAGLNLRGSAVVEEEEGEGEREPMRGTWRASFFGTGRFW